MPKVELKRSILYSDEVALSTLTQGNMYPLMNLTQAAGISGRVGNSVTVKGFHIKGLFNNNASFPMYIRMVVVWSTADTTTTFASADMFGDRDLTGNTGTVSQITGANILYYPINKLKYKVVSDRVIKLGGSGDPSCTRMFSRFHKMNTTVKFAGNNAGDTFQDKNLSIIFFAAEAADDTVGGQTIEASYIARAFYTDV